MSNTLSPYFPEFWAKTAQTLHKPTAIYRQVANFRAEADMKFGDTYHRILPNRTEIQDYQRYTDIDAQDITGTDQSLTVNKQKAFRFQVDDLDEVQSNVALASTYAKNAVRDMTNVIDSDFMYEVLNAGNTVDDGVIGGTSGNPISLSGSNVFETFSQVYKFLAQENIEFNNLYGVIDPDTFQVILSQVGSRETSMGDTVTKNGFKGNMIRYNGMDLYLSNNYTRQVVLDLATQPTANDTVTYTIGGTAVTFTFVSSIGSTAGNVLIGANVDATRANLETLINAPGTTTATGVAFTGTSLYLLQQCAAVNSNSANTLTFYSKGRTLSASETLTDATDGFDSTQASKSLMFGRRGAVDMVTQVAPKMDIRKEPRQFSTNINGTALYGVKTFTDGADQLVQVRVASV